jgi:peptidoglycan/LPS O-acetylase OafA/YrhL
MVKGKNIDELMNERKNNFDIIRFFAAALVIFSHTYPLTTGSNGTEPFGVLSNGQMTFGELAVKVFFVISGFLITQSFDRSKDLVKYAKARILRIFPALIVVVSLSALILGPIFTNLPLKKYFLNHQTIDYFKTITLYWIRYDLPGVFQSSPYHAVNGSLWTLWYEFFFYIVVAILGVTKLLNKKIVVVGFIAATILFYLGRGTFYTDLFRYFSMGMLIYLFRKNIIHNGWFALISFVVVALTIKTHYFTYFLSIFGSYLIFYLAFNNKLKFYNFGKYGDFSYGLYIYGFPVQQMVVHLSHNQLSILESFLISFPITLVFAFLSWRIVEKNALKLKKVSIITNTKSLIKNWNHSNNIKNNNSADGKF